MSTPSSKFPAALVAVVAVACCVTASAMRAEEGLPDNENGRYTLSLVTGGVMRLDTRTGAVSSCTNSEQGWACYVVPDERAAFDAEIGRLQAENQKLKARLAEHDSTVTGKIDQPLPKSDPLNKAEPKVADGARKIEIPLPSDQDVDRVMSFLERAWRRLMEMANRVQKDVSGKI
jgi:hypothetical protein